MLSISRFVHMFVCLSVCLFTFDVPFKHLFTPTAQSQMSNIFRDSESLGKSNGKKWSQILKQSFSLRLTVFLPPFPEVQCPKFLDIQNLWGKVMERSGLTFEHFCLEVV